MDKCYSTNEEDFSHNSVDEAVESLLDDTYLRTGETATLWEGDPVKHSASRYLTNVAEGMMEQACGECGEYAEGWDFSRAQSDSLQEAVAKAVDEWATANNMQPHFYTVENVAPFTVRFTDDDGGFEILPGENVKCDATALMGGVAGWLSGEWKVGIHDLLGGFIWQILEGEVASF